MFSAPWLWTSSFKPTTNYNIVQQQQQQHRSPAVSSVSQITTRLLDLRWPRPYHYRPYWNLSCDHRIVHIYFACTYGQRRHAIRRIIMIIYNIVIIIIIIVIAVVVTINYNILLLMGFILLLLLYSLWRGDAAGRWMCFFPHKTVKYPYISVEYERESMTRIIMWIILLRQYTHTHEY